MPPKPGKKRGPPSRKGDKHSNWAQYLNEQSRHEMVFAQNESPAASSQSHTAGDAPDDTSSQAQPNPYDYYTGSSVAPETGDPLPIQSGHRGELYQPSIPQTHQTHQVPSSFQYGLSADSSGFRQDLLSANTHNEGDHRDSDLGVLHRHKLPVIHEWQGPPLIVQAEEDQDPESQRYHHHQIPSIPQYGETATSYTHGQSQDLVYSVQASSSRQTPGSSATHGYHRRTSQDINMRYGYPITGVPQQSTPSLPRVPFPETMRAQDSLHGMKCDNPICPDGYTMLSSLNLNQGQREELNMRVSGSEARSLSRTCGRKQCFSALAEQHYAFLLECGHPPEDASAITERWLQESVVYRCATCNTIHDTFWGDGHLDYRGLSGDPRTNIRTDSNACARAMLDLFGTI